jgi:hypothetical protein
MASYFESGFTVLKELAKDKKAQEEKLEELRDIYDDMFDACKGDKACTKRFIDAYSDCD